MTNILSLGQKRGEPGVPGDESNPVVVLGQSWGVCLVAEGEKRYLVDLHQPKAPSAEETKRDVAIALNITPYRCIEIKPEEVDIVRKELGAFNKDNLADCPTVQKKLTQIWAQEAEYKALNPIR